MSSDVGDVGAIDGRPRSGVSVEPPHWIRWVDRLSLGLAVLAGLATAMLMVHVGVNLIGRNLIGTSAPAVIGASANWWMVTLSFCAMGYTQLQGEHVRATMLTEYMPAAFQKGASVAALGILAVFGVLLINYGWIDAMDSARIRETLLTSQPPLPIWPFKFLIPVAGVSTVLQCVASIYRELTAASVPSPSGQGV